MRRLCNSDCSWLSCKMGLHYQSVCCLIIVFLAAIFRPAFSSENTDIYLIQDNVDPIGVTGVGSTGIGSFLPLILPIFVMMMPVRMADGTMMTLMQMMMMSPTTTPSTTPATPTTMKVTPQTPCVPRCPGGFTQLNNPSVSPKCFRAIFSPATFLKAVIECSRTPNAYLWCPGSYAEDEEVRSKFNLGTKPMKTGCNDFDKKGSFMCVGSKRTCNPKKPPYGDGDSSKFTTKRCVDVAFNMRSKDRRKWSIVDCNSKNVFVCEVPITPCH